jgi:hypothetical protein
MPASFICLIDSILCQLVILLDLLLSKVIIIFDIKIAAASNLILISTSGLCHA